MKGWFEWAYRDMLSFFPENVSTFGGQLDNLFAFVYWISVVIFLLTYFLLVLFMVKYRNQPNRKAYHFHGSNIVEFTWTILPTFLFVGIGVVSEDLWTKTKYEMKVPKSDVEVDVMGYQFGWQMRYPGPDGVFGKKDRYQMSKTNLFGIDSNDVNGKDDIVIENAQLHLPINKNVVVNLSTADVLHSFFLPNFRVKQDAVPGKWIKVWFNGTKAGKYEIACAELCGSSHYAMRGEIFMYSQQDYDKWLDSKNKSMIELMQMRKKAEEAALAANTTTEETSTEEGKKEGK